jgi:type VI protein secretion system component Hcp
LNRSILLLAAAHLILCGALLAQSGFSGQGIVAQPASPKPDQSEITVATGLQCSGSEGTGVFQALGWSWGVDSSASTTSGGTKGTANATLADLVVTKRFDECSPQLFQSALEGTLLPSLLLTQTDSNGIPSMTIQLQGILVTSIQLSGSESARLPAESITFNARRIAIKDVRSGTQASWDIEKNMKF